MIDDRLALADRFGLTLGFHAIDQETYLAIIDRYAELTPCRSTPATRCCGRPGAVRVRAALPGTMSANSLDARGVRCKSSVTFGAVA